MRQCPDCEEKDRVVIAGKVFCANCGTPWVPVNTAEEQPYLAKVGLVTAAPATGPVAPAAQPAPAASTPVPPVAVAPTPVPAPPKPLPPVAPPVPPVPAPSAPARPLPPMVPAPTPMPVPLTPPPAPTSAPAPVSPPASPAPAPVAPPAPLPVPPPAAPVPPPVASAPAPAQVLREEIGSEIPTLDGNDISVLSDAQFQQLAQTAMPPAPAPLPPVAPTQPAPAQPPAPASSAPVTSASPNPVDGIVRPAAMTMPAPAAAAPVSLPAVPTNAADTTTVAGITMSRDDALKLALGTEAAPAAAPEKPGPARPIALVMSVIAVTMLGAYLVNTNYPAFALKLASVRSGMDASLPSYVPSGWKADSKVVSSQGELSYKLTNQDHSLNVAQKKTDWDSQSVLEQYVLPRATDYLALQAQGLTIYIFADNQAAWVNHGTFYHIDGNHGLNQEDIIRVATSL